MGISRMLRMHKSPTNRDNAAGSSDPGFVDSHGTMEAGNSPSSLPIASQFMRSPTFPPSASRLNEDNDNSHLIQRKPVPSETLQNSYKAGPHPSTVRIVPQDDSDYSMTGQEQRDSVLEDLAADISQVDLRNDRHSLKANNAARSLLEGKANIETTTGIPKRSLDKPLPMPPDNVAASNEDSEKSMQKHNQRTEPSDIQTLEQELGVEGQIDLSRTEDTDIRTHWEPAVTHQTIREDVHEIEEQRITRDIHVDHVYHRILPVEEVEVLPARHYVFDRNGTLQEVSTQRSSRHLDKYIQKGISKGLEQALPTANAHGGSRVFSAREFVGEEGDYKKSIGPDGSIRSENSWVHAPTLQTGGIASGQTRPFHIGSTNPEDDGWRI